MALAFMASYPPLVSSPSFGRCASQNLRLRHDQARPSPARARPPRCRLRAAPARHGGRVDGPPRRRECLPRGRQRQRCGPRRRPLRPRCGDGTPNADLVEGLDGVRGYRFGFISTPGIELRFELVRAEVSQSADMGWTLAIADITIDNPDGPPAFSLVRDFHTWKKQPDGSWKVIGDIWNTGPEPAADTAALNPS